MQKVVRLQQPPTEALALCARALASSGFSDIEVNDAAQMISGKKRQGGQWTAAQLTVFVQPVDTAGGTSLLITSNASAQSLTGLFSNPAKRMISDFSRALGVS